MVNRITDTTMIHDTSDTTNTAGKAPKTGVRGKPKTKRQKNLHERNGVWYFRRSTLLPDGTTFRESFSLETRDPWEARAKANAHLLKPLETTKEKSDSDSRTESVESAIKDFIADRELHGARPATIRGYESFCKIFAEAFPGTKWQTLTPEALAKFLRARYTSPVSAACAARHFGALFSFATKAKLLTNAPLTAYRFKKPLTDTAVEFLTLDECAALLKHGTEESLPAIILGLFAGIRPDEVARLDWRAINREERVIRIDASVSKTRTPRNIEGVPDALWRHLAPFVQTEGPVCNWPRKPLEATRKAAGLTRWPHDALRHTFATYYCAHTGNPGVVAHVLGHANLGMLTRHYNGVARKSEAEKFFAL